MRTRKYKGKVVLAIVTGNPGAPIATMRLSTWLNSTRSIMTRVLEINALDFEEPDQEISSLKRVNAFIKQYSSPTPT